MRKADQDLQIYIEQTKALLAQKKFDLAEKIILEGIKKYPEIADLYVLLSNTIYAKDGPSQNWYRYAEKAYKTSPQNIESLICFGTANLTFGNTERALELLHQAYKENPKSYAVTRNLAICYLKKGDRVKGLIFSIKTYLIKPTADIFTTIVKQLILILLSLTAILILFIAVPVSFLSKTITLLISSIIIYGIIMIYGGYLLFSIKTNKLSTKMVFIASIFAMIMNIISIIMILSR